MPSEITYKGKQYIFIDGEPNVGDMVAANRNTGWVVFTITAFTDADGKYKHCPWVIPDDDKVYPYDVYECHKVKEVQNVEG